MALSHLFWCTKSVGRSGIQFGARARAKGQGQGQAWLSKRFGKPGGARRSQEEPGGARGSQEEPGGARGSQGQGQGQR